MWPFNRKVEPEEILRPGICECEHRRCSHLEGRKQCTVTLKEDGEWIRCACKVYIRDKDNDNGPEPQTPSPSELERMLGISR